MVRRIDALGLHIALLVNNAGFATAGRCEQLDPATDHTQAMLNVVAVVTLTHQVPTRHARPRLRRGDQRRVDRWVPARGVVG